MARRKKNPLGDFEDALSSLGYGSQEGGDSVTNIDNQDMVNQVLDDPNDAIDNLDNPDDDESTEDKDKKNVTGDPNAHDDDTDIPDNILNNTSTTTVDNSEEDETEEEVVIDNPDNNQTVDPGEAEQIGAFFDAFAEANGWSVTDDEKPKSVEDLVDYIKDVVDENSTPQYADERIAKLDQYVKNGGRFEDFYQTQQRSMSFDNIDMEDESN